MIAPDSFYAASPWLIIAGQLAIALFFVYRGLDGLRVFETQYVRQIAARGVPMARLVAAGGFATLLIGGGLVAVDLYAAPAAGALIVFTLLANHWFHHFWLMGGMERTVHFYFFCNNIAVIGGLLLVMAINW